MPAWFLSSLVVLVGWGIWGFLAKIASRDLPPFSVFFYSVLGSLVVLFVGLPWNGMPSLGNGSGAFFAFMGGLIAAAVFLPYVFALTVGKVAAVVTVTALYPLVTIALMLLFFRETLAPMQWVGVFFALLAVIFLERG